MLAGSLAAGVVVTLQREGALQKAGGSGTDVPFRAKDMEKAGGLFLKRVMTVTWKQACVP